jgi:hypothetical protein
MPASNSPIEYLIVFAIVFAAGALWSACSGYLQKVRGEAS